MQDSLPNAAAKQLTRIKWAIGVYWLFIFVCAHVPLQRPPSPFAFKDKVFHLVAYSGLAFLLATYQWLRNRELRLREAVGIVGLLASYGVVDEVLQIPVGRTCDVYDWIADVLGAITGLGVFVFAAFLRRRYASPTLS